MGIKFFIIDFIFKSCPKLRQRYDTPYIIWTNLPTDLQLKERSSTTLSRRVSDSTWKAEFFISMLFFKWFSESDVMVS